MVNSRIGIWLIGVKGGVAATAIIGARGPASSG